MEEGKYERWLGREREREKEVARYGFHSLGTGIPGRHADAKVRNRRSLDAGLSLMYLFIEALILFFVTRLPPVRRTCSGRRR